MFFTTPYIAYFYIRSLEFSEKPRPTHGTLANQNTRLGGHVIIQHGYLLSGLNAYPNCCGEIK